MVRLPLAAALFVYVYFLIIPYSERAPFEGAMGWVAERRSCRLGILEIRCRPRTAAVEIRKKPYWPQFLPFRGVLAGANRGAAFSLQSLRSAPSGRSSEQGLAQASTLHKAYAAVERR